MLIQIYIHENFATGHSFFLDKDYKMRVTKLKAVDVSIIMN